MVINFFQFLGAVGLVLISAGVLIKKRKQQNIYYIFGGIFLLTYSISISNFIFITLQSVFILAAIYDLIKLKK